MSIRSIKKHDKATSPWALILSEFPKEKDGVIYVRQSSLTQQQKNIHSYEMQTEKFLEHFRDMGCSGHIEIIADDEAMSGTLDIHARPGMTKIVQMIESGKVGWIAAVAVNRFTRDKWLITPGVLMKLCHDHNVWIATLRMHFNFKDSYCQRVFMIEAEEAARHLEWMKLVLGGAKETASSNGYYDGRYIVPGYIVDRTDPLRKKYVVYEPHAEVVQWLFRRFLELDGNFPQLCREVEALPSVFPTFEPWVDSKTMSRFSLYRKDEGNLTEDGHYRLSRHGLTSILTNPTYIGWWIPQNGGVIEDNHDALIEKALFTYAHKRLSTYDLMGERQKPGKVTRHSSIDALLARVVIGPDDAPVYVSRANRTYTCRDHRGRIIAEDLFAVSVQVIDSVFLEKFLERIQSIDSIRFADWQDKCEKKRLANEAREALIRKGMREAELKMKRINELLTSTSLEDPLPPSMIADLLKQYKGVEAKKLELERELQAVPDEAEEEEVLLYEIHTLIPKIVTFWDYLPFEKKVRLISALVNKVILNRVTPGWVTMEVQWKLSDWGADVASIRRGWSGTHWTAEEEARLHALYPTEDAVEILKAFPNKSWRTIKQKAAKLHLSRERTEANSLAVNTSPSFDLSYEDLAYAREKGLVVTTKNAQWAN